MSYTDSPLVVYTALSPNHSGLRNHAIDRITPHCVVGQLSVEALGNIFLPEERQAGSNYGIGPDGRVAMYVEEKNRSWCSSSPKNDQRCQGTAGLYSVSLIPSAGNPLFLLKHLMLMETTVHFVRCL